MTTGEDGPRGRGRPRDAAIDAALLGETQAALDTAGYARLSLEEVARRAGTSKPAVYRRWPTRQQLVLVALAQRLGRVRPPDTSCTMCDLGECLQLYVDAFARMPPGVLAALLADCAGDTALREEFMSTLFEPPRAAVQHTLARALGRGDLHADLDLGIAVDVLGSFIHYRVLFGHAPTSPADIEAVVETVLRGMAADYPRLLAAVRDHERGADQHQLHRA